MSELTSHHKKKYGAWAGRPEGAAPDPERCAAEVSDTSSRWPRYSQCSRKRGHGPESAFCKQHDPDAIAKREAATAAREKARSRKWLLEMYGARFFAALKKIADGDNDPRQTALDAIKGFDDQ